MAQGADRGAAANVAEVRDLIDAWAEAVRERNLDGVLVSHAEDIVYFDVPPPVQSRGLDAYRRSWVDEFFPWFGASGVFEVDELRVTASADVAFCHGLIRCGGTGPNGGRTDELTVRLTVCLAKIDGRWAVVHEHHSEPSR